MARPMGYAPTYTMILSDSTIVNFQTNKIKLELSDDKTRVTAISASPKDNGLSLVFQDPSKIVTILRDTSVHSNADYDTDEDDDGSEPT